MELLKEVAFWHWWMLAGLLLLVEMWAPTYFFLWLGIAAAAVGFLVLVFAHMPFQVQFIAFAALSVIAVFTWHRLRDGAE